MLALASSLFASSVYAASSDPAATDYSGNKGKTIYVSKLGDNSDGSSWHKAFHTIQAALSAVPDNKGGHQIIVRPDRYVEANLAPAYPGAAGAYNALIGDFDGSLGSGAQGLGAARFRRSRKGFQELGLVGTVPRHRQELANRQQDRADVLRDRLRSLDLPQHVHGRRRRRAVLGSDNQSGEGFTVIVEDCIGTGRAFGGGLAYPVVRPKEPSVFRRCYFLALDYVGDTAAVLMGGWEKTMPKYPHAVFEDCTMVHPDNAVAMSYAANCTRVKCVNCRMIVLNFTQPEMGGKSTGILCTEGHGPDGRLHVDLEDCILAGYCVLTPGKESNVASYTTKGKVQAYVQFKQPCPQGFNGLGLWPTELFSQMAPPRTPEELKTPAGRATK